MVGREKAEPEMSLAPRESCKWRKKLKLKWWTHLKNHLCTSSTYCIVATSTVVAEFKCGLNCNICIFLQCVVIVGECVRIGHFFFLVSWENKEGNGNPVLTLNIQLWYITIFRLLRSYKTKPVMSLNYFIWMRHLPSFVLRMPVWHLYSQWLMVKLIELNRVLDWDIVFQKP